MASHSAISDPITANDMAAVTKVDWEKLAAQAGFKDGATAKAHYEPFLNPNHPGDTLGKPQNSHDNKAALNQFTTGVEGGNKHLARNYSALGYPSGLEDGEA
ncbi:hypothetical protein GGR54DRAFT_644349 [Hypoxylon sp. NC1633]|nr:hypothetical protein GGR54DRAFT_644349 [Hypoxylon sp. NC1633]